MNPNVIEEINSETGLRALVVYGTRWGGTVKVAEKIGATLTKQGIPTHVVDAKNSPSVKQYDIVIVGSGISAGSWTKDASCYLKNHAEELREKKTALFVSCGAVEKEDQKERDADYDSLLVAVARKYGLSPVSYGFFGGILDFKANYTLFEKLIVTLSKNKLKRLGIDTTKPYDFRDWNQIETWAKTIAQITLSASV